MLIVKNLNVFLHILENFSITETSKFPRISFSFFVTHECNKDAIECFKDIIPLELKINCVFLCENQQIYYTEDKIFTDDVELNNFLNILNHATMSVDKIYVENGVLTII